MPDHVTTTRLQVSGIRTDDEVRRALQALYDRFAELGVGAATFEVADAGPARLYIKHRESVAPDTGEIAAALARAGDFRLVG
ncbi:hypothetical protein [Agromyces archimandritae]|uniref:Uncharacterized protein n=1 Tax=Agromyces archimandritae TaxID=2781962 RepID=A0A975IR91_9MICO|nr:hypothetical protein [Agromyces archimandritae]QTX05841.1 hypothetical protein G127AT_06490 [Agromyces archimandritae]